MSDSKYVPKIRYDYETEFEVKEEDLNNKKTLFGGKIMDQLDLAGAFASENLLENFGNSDKVFIRHMDVEFLAPAFLGEKLEVKSFVMTATGTSLNTLTVILLGGKEIAKAIATYVTIDPENLRKKEHGICYAKT